MVTGELWTIVVASSPTINPMSGFPGAAKKRRGPRTHELETFTEPICRKKKHEKEGNDADNARRCGKCSAIGLRVGVVVSMWPRD